MDQLTSNDHPSMSLHAPVGKIAMLVKGERERSTRGDRVLFSSVGLWEGFLDVKITRIPYHYACQGRLVSATSKQWVTAASDSEKKVAGWTSAQMMQIYQTALR